MVESPSGKPGSPAAVSAPRRGGALPAVATSVDRVGLADVKDRGGPRHLAALGLLLVIRIGRFVAHALWRDPGRDLDAMFPAPDPSAQCAPGVIGEHVLARLDVGFRDTLGREAFEDGRPVAEGLSA